MRNHFDKLLLGLHIRNSSGTCHNKSSFEEYFLFAKIFTALYEPIALLSRSQGHWHRNRQPGSELHLQRGEQWEQHLIRLQEITPNCKGLWAEVERVWTLKANCFSILENRMQEHYEPRSNHSLGTLFSHEFLWVGVNMEQWSLNFNVF